MADAYLTLADLVVINDQNLADIDVSDLLDDAPLLRTLAADTASNGTSHKYTKETAAPVVGFRDVNNGRENTKSTDTLVTVTLEILDASFACDKALADVYKHGVEAYIAREARRHLRAAYFAAENQFLYGVGADSNGFAGMADNAGLDAIADAMVINGGSAVGSINSSVWAIRTTGDMGHVTAISGQDGNIEIGETIVQRLAGATGWYPGYYTPITTWLGLQIGSAKSVGRLCNLDAGSNKLADTDMSDLLELFPSHAQPTHFVMSRRSRAQLQASRTATNATGAPAPRPTEYEGIPIITTEAIDDTEAVIT